MIYINDKRKAARQPIQLSICLKRILRNRLHLALAGLLVIIVNIVLLSNYDPYWNWPIIFDDIFIWKHDLLLLADHAEFSQDGRSIRLYGVEIKPRENCSTMKRFGICMRIDSYAFARGNI